MKDQTYEELSDPVPGSLTDEAKWRGTDSTQHGGKHGEVQEETETWLEQVLDATNHWLKLRIRQACSH